MFHVYTHYIDKLILFHPQAKKNCEFRDYDTLVKELIFDRTGKAKAVEKLKTPEQLISEERERLLAQEADRVRRMKGEKPGTGAKPKSADDLDDGWVQNALPVSIGFVIFWHFWLPDFYTDIILCR